MVTTPNVTVRSDLRLYTSDNNSTMRRWIVLEQSYCQSHRLQIGSILWFLHIELHFSPFSDDWYGTFDSSFVSTDRSSRRQARECICIGKCRRRPSIQWIYTSKFSFITVPWLEGFQAFVYSILFKCFSNVPPFSFSRMAPWFILQYLLVFTERRKISNIHYYYKQSRNWKRDLRYNVLLFLQYLHQCCNWDIGVLCISYGE